MPWLEFSIEAKQDLAEAFEDFLLESGAYAVTMQNLSDKPIYEPEVGTTPLWQLNLITGLFDTNLQEQKLFDALQQRFNGAAPDQFKVEILEDRDWEREWLKHYQSMCFGDSLWIVPSDELLDISELPKEIHEDHIVIRMDPGLAFGTGTHETTALCLEWLAQNDLNNKTLVDYGCGSGILGIAGSLLGAKHIFGCDLDPQAITASHDNALRNNISNNYLMEDVPSFQSTIKNHLATSHNKVDILVANILAGPLEQLCPDLANLLDSGGIIVLSGILKEQADALVETYRHFFDDIQVVLKNDWVRVVATKR